MFKETELYPTPKNVIELMLQGEDITNKVILEPEAGLGSIVDVLYEKGAKTVLACEENEDLRKILQTKCNVICNDFLTLESDKISHIDYIIMNPPFSSADKHLLYAYEIAPAGCKIIGLCNLNTLENDFSETRKRLKNIILENGNYENIGNAFHDADRKTDVNIALIKIQKAGVNYNTEFEGFFLDDDEPELQANAIMPYNVIRDLVNRYVAAIKIFDEQLVSAIKMNNLTSGFFSGDVGMNISVEQKPIKRDEFIKSLQKSGWAFIFQKMNMSKYATRGLKDDINKFVEQQQNIPFTMKNIYKMLEIVIGTQSQRMDKAIIEVFDKITKHYDENRFNVEGWKTNSWYLVNRRFIIPYMVKIGWHGEVDTQYSSAETIQDFVKALCYITGDNYSDMISLESYIENPYKLVKDGKYVNDINYDFDVKITARYNDYNKILRQQQEYYGSEIEHSKVEWGKWFDWGYFRCRAYKKGTMHFEFKDENVWAMFNQHVSRINGYPLPESMKPKESKKKDKSVKTETTEINTTEKQIINPIDMNLTKNEISENPSLAMETLNSELSTAKQQLEIATEGDEKQFVETKIKRLEAEIELVKESIIPKFDINETIYIPETDVTLAVKSRYVDIDGKYKYNLTNVDENSIVRTGVTESEMTTIAEKEVIDTEKEKERIEAEALEQEAEKQHIEGKREYIKKKISVFETLLSMADKKDKPFLNKKISVFKTLLEMESEEMACGGSMFGCGGKMGKGGKVDSFNYMMLDRLRSDCNYFLGNGNRNEKVLWAGNVDAQIKEMKRLWNILPKDKKPEWLSMQDILEYEKKMKNKMEDGGYINEVSCEDIEKTDLEGIKYVESTVVFDNGEVEIFEMRFIDGKFVVKNQKKDKVIAFDTLLQARKAILGKIYEAHKDKSFEAFKSGGEIIGNYKIKPVLDLSSGAGEMKYNLSSYSGKFIGEFNSKKEAKKYLVEQGLIDKDEFGDGGKITGRGWGKYKKGERITNIKDMQIGDFLLQYNPQFNSKNIIIITKDDTTGLKRPIVYASYVRPNDLKIKEEDFAIWDYELKTLEIYKIKDKKLDDSGVPDKNNNPKIQKISKHRLKKLCGSSKIQTLLFDKDVFTKIEAKSWAKKHSFKSVIDETKNIYRIRQISPTKFKEESFRTIPITKGIQATIGCLKK